MDRPMTEVVAQEAVREYHEEMRHHGHDMRSFHVQWHRANRDPALPGTPDRHWAVDNRFGRNFLQMHHEMVKAADDEPKEHMHHSSIVSWYRAKGYDLPPEWNPMTPIPSILRFTPSDRRLERRTQNPRYALPAYFTLGGIASGQGAEPITGARRLADFLTIDQLGCCIVYPHNDWHMAIGGAMTSFATAIDDPIFYFGVHWHIDKVFDQFKAIVADRAHGATPEGVAGADKAVRPMVFPSEEITVANEFTPEQRSALERGVRAGEKLRTGS